MVEHVEVVIASGKGGVGKSTLTAVLAVELAKNGFNMVAVDADAEAPNLHLTLGVSSWDAVLPYHEGRIAYIVDEKCSRCGICKEVCPLDAVEVIEDRYSINQWICEGCLTCSLACPDKAIRYKFKILAGHIMIKKETSYGFPLVSSSITPGRPNSGKLVTEVKNQAHSMLKNDGFLIIDAAAGIGCQVVSSLTGAKIAILVVEPTPASLNDLKRIHRLTQHFMIAPAIVVNKYDINPDGVNEILEYAENNDIPILGMIPYDENIPKNVNSGIPIHLASPDTPAAIAMTSISSKIISILADWRKWWIRYRPRKPIPYLPKIK